MTRELRPSLEHGLYILVFCLALSLRFANLGAAPLTEAEAQRALAAHQIAVGEPATGSGVEPAYLALTAATFTLLGSNEFLARFWPALFGSLLVLFPCFVSGVLGRKPAILFALALAVDPALVALSRQASGMLLGLGLAAFALLAWSRSRWTLAGVLAAFTLLSGPGIVFAALTLLLGWGVLAKTLGSAPVRAFVKGLNARKISSEGRRAFMLSGLAALFLLSTLFLRVPQALAGLGGSLSGLLAGSFISSGETTLGLLLRLLAYGLLPVLFGLLGLWRSWRDGYGFGTALGWLAFAGLLLVMIFPGAGAANLIWVLIPMWALAAMEFARILRLPTEEPLAALGELALLSLLFLFGALTLAEVTTLDPTLQQFRVNVLILGILALLALASVILIALGWSRQAAWRGFSWAIGLFLLVGLLAVSFRLAGRQPSAADLWSEGPAAGQTALLLSTLEDLSARAIGEDRALDVVLETDSAALAWTLRAWPKLHSIEQATGLTQPAAIISAEAGEQPARASAYRGQSFVLAQQPDWGRGWPPDLLKWLLFRETPVRSETVILWLRSDLFPDGGDAEAVNENNETDGSTSP
jgi:hypothetical protein